MNCSKRIVYVDAGGSDYSQKYVAEACHKFLLDCDNNVYMKLYISEYVEDIQKLLRAHDNVEIIKCDAQLRNADKYVRNSGTTMERAISDLYTDPCRYSAMLVFGNVKHASLIALSHEKASERLSIPSALISTIANVDHIPRIMTDLGASVTVNLVQLAMVASCFLQTFYHLDQYKIGFLNIGSEHNKGLPEIMHAAQTYQKHYPDYVYGAHGFVEPSEILMDNDCNAIICNGFNGNIALKAMQSAFNALKIFVHTKLNLVSKIATYPGLSKFRAHFNYDEHNGALLSKFRKPIIKSHGNAKSDAIIHALNRTVNFYMPNFEEFYAKCTEIDAKYKKLNDNGDENA